MPPVFVQIDPNLHKKMDHIPALLSEDEKFLYFQEASLYRGKGAVVEIGPWLGASTSQICRGLEVSGHEWSLTALGPFKWSPPHAGVVPQLSLKRGDSFLSLFQENVSSYSSKIRVVAGEIGDIEHLLHLSEAIELLFVNAPKSWRILWSVLHHLGPRLQRGSRILVKDCLSLTSWQVALLTAAIPELEPVEVASEGNSVVFTVARRLTSFGDVLPADMRKVSGARLVELWERVAATMSEARASDVGVGLALDLLERNETKLACLVLDRAVRGTPREAGLTEELSRQFRKTSGPLKGFLLEAIAYLRAMADPMAIRRARRRLEAAEGPRREPSDPSAHVDREAGFEMARALSSPKTASHLAIRHGMLHGVADEAAFRLLFRAFGTCQEIGLIEAAQGYAPYLPGARVVEVGGGIAINGPALRAFGAAHYTGILSPGDMERRVYRNPTTLVRAKTTFTPADIAAIDPGIAFFESVDAVSDGSVDVLVLHPGPTDADLDQALDLATRLLKPGGCLRLTWRNPRSWAGHGRAPQTVAEIAPGDDAQQKLLDWRHIGLVRASVPSLGGVRERVGRRMRIEAWQEYLDDPAAVIRLTPRVRSRYPELRSEDFICRSVAVIARS